MTITYRAEYSGHVDGERVAWMYRAFNEEGAPYVVVLDAGDEFPIALVQAPTEFLDGEADQLGDQQHAAKWVQALTRLVEKARAYDEIFDDIEDAERDCGLTVGAPFHDLHVVEDDDDWDDADIIPPGRNAYVVDELTDAEIDQEWSDRDCDRYKHIDGEWFISVDCGASPWEPISEFNALDLLSNYGPYVAVRS